MQLVAMETQRACIGTAAERLPRMTDDRGEAADSSADPSSGYAHTHNPELLRSRGRRLSGLLHGVQHKITTSAHSRLASFCLCSRRRCACSGWRVSRKAMRCVRPTTETTGILSSCSTCARARRTLQCRLLCACARHRWYAYDRCRALPLTTGVLGGRLPGTGSMTTSDGTCCIAESFVSPPPRSSLSSATTMPARVAPWAPMIAAASLAAVPAVITSSTMSARPASGAPTIVPPSPG